MVSSCNLIVTVPRIADKPPSCCRKSTPFAVSLAVIGFEVGCPRDELKVTCASSCSCR